MIHEGQPYGTTAPSTDGFTLRPVRSGSSVLPFQIPAGSCLVRLSVVFRSTPTREHGFKLTCWFLLTENVLRHDK